MSAASSLVRNIGANGLNQIANLAIQLALVPILAGHWGVATYGVWLILFAIPYYFSAGDLGLAVAAGNDMTASVAQGRRDEALHTFQTMLVGLIVLTVLFFGVTAWLVAGPLNPLLEFARNPSEGHSVTTFLLLVAYGLLAWQVSAVHSGMRATGAYARSVNFVTGVYVAEAAALAVAVFAGATIMHAAAIYCIGHLLGVLGLYWLLHRHAPWLRVFPLRPSWGELRRLAPAALAMLCVPLSYALAFQGPTLALGAVAGAAVVPAFSIVRLVTRAAVQVPVVVAFASMPNFTVATAQRDEARRSELVALALMTSLCVLIPAALFMIVFGQDLIALWTGGVIEPSFALVVTLAIAMVLSGTWWPLSVLIMAINEHGRYSYVFLALSAAAVALTAVLAKPFGVLGAGLATVALDAAMLVWILIQARKLGLIDIAALLAAPGTVLVVIRRFLGARDIRRKGTE
jgi:O-antigen/teichoic acid export membrane protein